MVKPVILIVKLGVQVFVLILVNRLAVKGVPVSVYLVVSRDVQPAVRQTVVMAVQVLVELYARLHALRHVKLLVVLVVILRSEERRYPTRGVPLYSTPQICLPLPGSRRLLCACFAQFEILTLS